MRKMRQIYRRTRVGILRVGLQAISVGGFPGMRVEMMGTIERSYFLIDRSKKGNKTNPYGRKTNKNSSNFNNSNPTGAVLSIVSGKG